MKLRYKIKIDNPQNHMVRVEIKGKSGKGRRELVFFLPSWSPGSYLMREYARHVRSFCAQNDKGGVLLHEQVDKGAWRVYLDDAVDFCIRYEVYCHELTVRTSHVDVSHAFLHGPSYLMGVEGVVLTSPCVRLEFPALWSKVATGLEDVSEKRDEFVYRAEDYDALIDTPIEIGCHESDGFRVQKIDHELAFYGKYYPHHRDMKKDMKIIVEYISSFMKDIPYRRYVFIVHFAPRLYGGLEHNNSCAIAFDGSRLADRKSYVDWLCLVSHEYFHTWNVKRIRPKELGPFDYRKENYTRLLWLAEGLTGFMDTLFVYRAGLMSTKEYLERLKNDFNRYLSVGGRRFHSLEESSFNAWIKLYRPDENTRNSTISYYNKGGIVFFVLNSMLAEKGKSIDDLSALLWDSYKKDPSKGLSDSDVFKMIEQIGGETIRRNFEMMISTTEEIDLSAACSCIGAKVEWKRKEETDLGFHACFEGDRVNIKSVDLDGPAFKSGLNAGDELLFVNGCRVLKDDFERLKKTLLPDTTYFVTVSRLGYQLDLKLHTQRPSLTIEEIQMEDEKKFIASLIPSKK